jgi:hypothetical protein
MSIESEKKRLNEYLEQQIIEHMANIARAKSHCAAMIDVSEHAIKTIKEHVAASFQRWTRRAMRQTPLQWGCASERLTPSASGAGASGASSACASKGPPQGSSHEGRPFHHQPADAGHRHG